MYLEINNLQTKKYVVQYPIKIKNKNRALIWKKIHRDFSNRVSASILRLIKEPNNVTTYMKLLVFLDTNL